MSAVTSIRRLQAHYFAIYAVFGCLTPFIPVYLRDIKELSPTEIGIIFATGQTGVLFMPVLMTFLADRYRVVRALLISLFVINVVAMSSLSFVAGFWACLFWVALNRMSNQPQVALGDGLYFTLQSDPAQPRATFAQVRVWGTLGFIVPSVILFAGYHAGGGVQWMPWVAAGTAAFGILNARGLPRRTARRETTITRMPTLAAARVLKRPRIALFCLGVGFVVFTNMAYYGFYPIYLTQQVGIDERWIGIISSVGVAVEIAYILLLERMRVRFGFGGLLFIGGLTSLFRLGCLAWLPTPFFATFFQVFHGLTVIGYLIVPVMYLNTLAEEGFRNSIQGLYVMLVGGIFSIAGNLFAGHVAEIGLLTLYRASFGICAFGLLLVALSFHRRRPTR